VPFSPMLILSSLSVLSSLILSQPFLLHSSYVNPFFFTHLMSTLSSLILCQPFLHSSYVNPFFTHLMSTLSSSLILCQPFLLHSSYLNPPIPISIPSSDGLTAEGEDLQTHIRSGTLQCWSEKIRSHVVSLSAGIRSSTARDRLRIIAEEVADMKKYSDRMTWSN
jgi:hypothetical protein